MKSSSSLDLMRTEADSCSTEVLGHTQMSECRWLAGDSDSQSRTAFSEKHDVGSLGGRVKVFRVDTRAVIPAIGLRH